MGANGFGGKSSGNLVGEDGDEEWARSGWDFGEKLRVEWQGCGSRLKGRVAEARENELMNAGPLVIVAVRQRSSKIECRDIEVKESLVK